MEALYSLKEEFLTNWPIERIYSLSLEEYTNLRKDDSFCYWLESRTTDLGSVWGGSSFKFGIYEKKQKEKYYGSGGALSDADYAWMQKYGTTRDEAFETIKSHVIEIIDAVKQQQYHRIDSIDMGDAIKWKIAYLYSDNQVLNIFKKKKLESIAAGLAIKLPANAEFNELQAAILAAKPVDEDYFDYSHRIWKMVETEPANKQYWLYAPGRDAVHWNDFYESGIIGLGWDELGDLQQYATKTDVSKAIIEMYNIDGSPFNDTAANDDFVRNINIGDIIIIKKGRSKLLGYGKVLSDYYYDDTRENYKSCRKVEWLKRGEWEANHSLVLKTLTNITSCDSDVLKGKKYYELLLAIMEGKHISITETNHYNPALDILYYKKQVILQGPPGTGKTKLAKELAGEILLKNALIDINDFKSHVFAGMKFKPYGKYSDLLIDKVINDTVYFKGTKSNPNISFAFSELYNYFLSNEWKSKEFLDYPQYARRALVNHIVESKYSEVLENNFKLVQFHPGYTYEDFVRGIVSEPDEDNKGIIYKAQNKILAGFAEKALYDTSSNYVLVIDEINRANLSSVLGELIYALEYRGEAVESMYAVESKGNELILPPNLYIIGTMNTADRSVGHVDYAIRRRFAFIDVLPKDLKELDGNDGFDSGLFKIVSALFDTNLSPEFEKKDVQLGHSYFIDKTDEGGPMHIRLEYEIKPILLEYVKDGILVGKMGNEDIKTYISGLTAAL